MDEIKKIEPYEDGIGRYAVDLSPMALPSLFVNSLQIPEIAAMEVGKKYRLLIEIEQKSKSEVSTTGEEAVVDARFNVIGYKEVTE